VTVYLADKSAYERRRHSDRVDAEFGRLVVDARLATCEIVAMGLLYSARNLAEYEAVYGTQRVLRWLHTTNEILDRAMEVQHLLAQRGQHRLPLPDLMIAATAEHYGATVLHHDRDYETISGVTGQPARWVEQQL
jgi:predicted nucleic acid-binding protein